MSPSLSYLSFYLTMLPVGLSVFLWITIRISGMCIKGRIVLSFILLSQSCKLWFNEFQNMKVSAFLQTYFWREGGQKCPYQKWKYTRYFAWTFTLLILLKIEQDQIIWPINVCLRQHFLADIMMEIYRKIRH